MAMKYFVYRLIPPRPTFVVDMTDHERATMAEHSAYWKDLLNAGHVVVFGPVLDPAGSYGLAVVQAASEVDVRDFGDNDPAVSSGMSRFEVCPMPVAVARPFDVTSPSVSMSDG